MIMNKKLKSRAIQKVLIDKIGELTPIDVNNCVIELKDGTILDVGSLCYKSFENVYGSTIKWVNEKNIDRQRFMFVRRLITNIRISTSKPQTKKIIFVRMTLFIEWINTTLPDTNFSSETEIKKAYEEYTKHLLFRRALTDSDQLKIKNNTASALQKTARIVCGLILDIEPRIISYWSTRILHNDRDSLTFLLTHSPLTDEERNATYAAHCELIDQTWRFFIERNSDSISVSKYTLLDDFDNLSENDSRNIYSKVCVSAFMSFLGASGANQTVARLGLLSEVSKDESVKGTRLAGIKSRAGDKWVYPEFSKKYEPIWKKWLAIRRYWLSKNNIETDLVFPYLNRAQEVIPLPDSLLDTTKSTAKLFTEKLGLKWVNCRQWRQYKSKLIGKSSANDIFISAEMLGHSVSTSIRHYATRDMESAVKEISAALDKVYESAVKRARFEPRSEVAITDQRIEIMTTAIGECKSEITLEPSLAKGFSGLAPKPDCSIKETCIFCEKYAVHADTTDIRKLLSLRFLINELTNNMSAEAWSNKWAIYIDRIDEILEEVINSSPSCKSQVSTIAEEIEYGELDDFWADWYRTLKYLGMITS